MVLVTIRVVTDLDSRTVVVRVLVEEGLGALGVVFLVLVGRLVLLEGLELVGLRVGAFIFVPRVTVDTLVVVLLEVMVDRMVVNVGPKVETNVLVDFRVLIVETIVVLLGTLDGNVDEVRVLVVVNVDRKLLIVVVTVVKVGLVEVGPRVDVNVTMTCDRGVPAVAVTVVIDGLFVDVMVTSTCEGLLPAVAVMVVTVGVGLVVDAGDKMVKSVLLPGEIVVVNVRKG